MAIWFTPSTLDSLRMRGKGTLVEHLGIDITKIGADYLEGTMPVDARTIQPMGLLHGGASVALAETLGSLAANLVVDGSKFYCVGLEINANHVRSAKAGIVRGRASLLHKGGTTQVWNIEIRDESENLVCISRLTMAVLTRRV